MVNDGIFNKQDKLPYATKKRRCRYIYPDTKKQCPTILNRYNQNKYCSAHIRSALDVKQQNQDELKREIVRVTTKRDSLVDAIKKAKTPERLASIDKLKKAIDKLRKKKRKMEKYY